MIQLFVFLTHDLFVLFLVIIVIADVTVLSNAMSQWLFNLILHYYIVSTMVLKGLMAGILYGTLGFCLCFYVSDDNHLTGDNLSLRSE